MKNKALEIAASLLTAAIVAGGVCACGYASRDKETGKWFKNKDIKSWSLTNEKPQEDNHIHTYDLSTWVQGEEGHWHASDCGHYIGVDYENHTYKNSVCTVCGYKYGSKGADMIVSTESENGIAVMSRMIKSSDYGLYGISPQSASAYVLTAEVRDETGTTNGVPQAVNAVADWENADSLWANGKDVNDYINIQRSADNAFVVNCLQAFGEPVLINVSSVASDVTAVKRCDYVSRVNGSYFTLEGGKVNIAGMPNNYTVPVNYGVGTLKGEIEYNELCVKLGDEFISSIVNSSYYKYFAQQCESAGVDFDWCGEFTIGFSKVAFDDAIEFYWKELFLCCMSAEEFNLVKAATNDCEYFRYAIIDAVNTCTYPCHISLCLLYSYSYNGIIYTNGGYTSADVAQIENSGLGNLPNITDITLGGDGGNFIF